MTKPFDKTANLDVEISSKPPMQEIPTLGNSSLSFFDNEINSPSSSPQVNKTSLAPQKEKGARLS